MTKILIGLCKSNRLLINKYMYLCVKNTKKIIMSRSFGLRYATAVAAITTIAIRK